LAKTLTTTLVVVDYLQKIKERIIKFIKKIFINAKSTAWLLGALLFFWIAFKIGCNI
jgi:hypothetical protein